MDSKLAASIKAIFATYAQARDVYYESVFTAVYDYLASNGSIASFKSDMKSAMASAFLEAAEIGWEDGGGKLPLDSDVSEWLSVKTEAEISYIDVLFQSLKELRKEEDVKKAEVAESKADGYAKTLDTIYNQAKIAAAGSKMLTFVGDDGEESCSDCRRYKNKRHKASWWISHNAVPPNRDFECHGYNCLHVLVDDTGKLWTL